MSLFVSSSTRFAACPARRRAAFTLIEVLVVIAIIVALIGISVVAGSAVKRSMNQKVTKSTMTQLRVMMADYLKEGNPEPTVPSPWPYASNVPTAYEQTNPPSDPYNWVRALSASTRNAAAFAKLPQIRDPFDNTRILVVDGFNNPIRYFPSLNGKDGYFQSAGRDGVFVNTVKQPTGSEPPLAQDDVKSTDTF
jgi:prepilin-type N-terminal cleavage/methylation domain-containing protein